MPNGVPGDDPLMDILVHKRRVFSPAIDALIIEIVNLGGEKKLRADLGLFASKPREVFEAELRTLRDRLRQEAKDRGWEVD